MKTSFVAALALAAASAAHAVPTVIDFNGLSGLQGASFALSGVTFSTVPSGGSINATTTPNGTIGLLEESTPRLGIRATFASLVSSVSIDLGDNAADADLLVLRAYSTSNVLLGSSTLSIPATASTMFTLSVAAAGISYVVFGSELPSVNGSSVYADNLRFDTAPIPEPATAAMALLGLAGIGLWRQRAARRA